jgi:chromosome segregation ATPase
MKVLIFLLVLVCAGLGYGVYKFNEQAAEGREEADRAMREARELSEQLAQTSSNLEEQLQVNQKIDSDLAARTAALQQVSNEVQSLRANLALAEAKAAEEAKAAADAITKKQAEIQELEGRNANLNNRMTDLTTAIEELESQIADTERKLAASEGDREFLLAELSRLQSEKVDLERQFNDLALLRGQIRKLRDELSLASRLEWIRRGLYGSQLPETERLEPGYAEPVGSEPVDLEVEIRQDGGARVIEEPEVPTENP